MTMRTISKVHLIAAPSCALARRTGLLLRRLAIETDGQDLIEYALLTTFIGCAGAAGWGAMQAAVGVAYSSYIAAVWNLWEPADPVGGGA
jgi:Flp pilus assembly pilin Flp